MSAFAKVLMGVLAAAAVEPVDIEGLLAALRSDWGEEQWAAMQQFAEQADAPAAIPRLFEEMRKAAPKLDNNVGLMVEMILVRHPDAPCPVEPLLEGIQRRIWNSQQKCAQALCHLLERGDGKERQKELAGKLIPLLASQRPRVFDAAECCLKALTGQDLGDLPDAWLEWYESKFATAVDMTGAVYEDLVVVESRLEGEGQEAVPVYRVEGEEIRDVEALEAALGRRAAAARSRGLHLEVSIRISDERMQALALKPDELWESKDIHTAMSAVRSQGIAGIVVSPQSDAFRPPWRGSVREQRR